MKVPPPVTASSTELEQVRSQLREWKKEYERVSGHFAALTQARLSEQRHIIDQLKAASRQLESGNISTAKAGIVKLLTALQPRGDDRQTLFDMQQECPGGASAT